jgi:hypothetical protein
MKKALLILVPLLLVGGGAVGAAMMGIVQIPGLSPAKKKANAAAAYGEQPDEAPVVKKEPAPEPETPAPDLEKGRRALAKLWNEMDPKTLLPIVESWKDEDLAHQLRYLEADLTATLLAGMKPDRASRLSRSLQAIAAVEGPVEPAN